MATHVVLGVDSSTTATKGIAFDARGLVVAESAQHYGYDSVNPGWAEQNANTWWQALCKVCNDVISHPAMKEAVLDGIAITHQRFTFVPVDDDINPLRPAILWNDLRCAEQSEHARSMEPEAGIFLQTGYPPGQWTLYKALWLKKHEPELYQRTWKLMLVADFLNYQLTGEVCTSEGYAAMTGALDIRTPNHWAVPVIEQLGVRSDIWIDRILPGAALAGSVTARASAETGLSEGIPVFTAAGDQPCGSLGAGVVEPGQMGINGGTSCSNEFLVESLPALDDPTFFVEISPAGKYLVENDIPSGGSAVMKWYRGAFGAAEVAEAQARGIEPWDVIYGMAEGAPVGNSGFMIVPYLQGVYGPYWDQNARGVAIGLRADYGRAELVRALLEGVAYESRRETELMRIATQCTVEEIHMYGGSSRSSLWNQMFADMFGCPVLVSSTPETTALGAAMAAAVGSGLISDFPTAVASMTSVSDERRPNKRAKEIYDRYFNDVYQHIYDSVAALNASIADIDNRIRNHES